MSRSTLDSAPRSDIRPAANAMPATCGHVAVMPQQVARLGDAVGINRKLIEELGARLSCVIPNLPEDCGGAPDSPECMVSPLADDLRRLAKQVEDGNTLIGGFLRRMEI